MLRLLSFLCVVGFLVSACGATTAPARPPGQGEKPLAGGAGPDEPCPLGCHLRNGGCTRVKGHDAPPAANVPVKAEELEPCPGRCCPRQLQGPDSDGDGIADAADRCPTAPEDRDGFEDVDGCPEPDNDGDGVMDVNDRCPNDAGPRDGCP